MLVAQFRAVHVLKKMNLIFGACTRVLLENIAEPYILKEKNYKCHNVLKIVQEK